MRHHRVTAAHGVLSVAERVVFRCRLWEPNIASVTTEMARLESFGNILLDNDGTACGVDEPRACIFRLARPTTRIAKVQLTLLHLGDQFLVEQASGLLVQWAVDGDNVALGQHFLQVIHTSASNLLLNLGFERLVIEVQQLLAVEWLESPQHTFTNTPNSDRTYNFVLEVVFILRNSGNVPVSTGDLLVCWDEVANQGEDSHENMLCHRYDVGTSHFGDGDTTIGFVRGIQVNVVRSNASGNGELELFCFCESLGGQITWMEAEGKE